VSLPKSRDKRALSPASELATLELNMYTIPNASELQRAETSAPGTCASRRKDSLRHRLDMLFNTRNVQSMNIPTFLVVVLEWY
jgi:hypothetical protein